MNAVEIEAALSDLALAPFQADEFAYQFLAAFGNKDTTLKRLRSAELAGLGKAYHSAVKTAGLTVILIICSGSSCGARDI